MKKVDAIIIGQGLAGSCMAMTLLDRGCSVHVFDPMTHVQGGPKNASRSAAGLFNPITGRKMVKTWLADQLFEGLESFYRKIESLLSIECFYPVPMYRPFLTIEDQNDWVGADQEDQYLDYIDQILTGPIGIDGVQDPYGGLIMKRTGYVDLPLLLDSIRLHLESKEMFSAAILDESHLVQKEEDWYYQEADHQIQAKWVIHCGGLGGKDSQYWSGLKFKPVKGEWLEMELEIPSNLIVNRGVFMIPRDGKVRVGATYDHSDLSTEVSEKGKSELIERMSKIFTGEYRILGQNAGVRPATYDRKPFVGLHREFEGLAILNGFGAKGVTLAPYFAGQLAEFLLANKPVMKEVDSSR